MILATPKALVREIRVDPEHARQCAATLVNLCDVNWLAEGKPHNRHWSHNLADALKDPEIQGKLGPAFDLAQPPGFGRVALCDRRRNVLDAWPVDYPGDTYATGVWLVVGRRALIGSYAELLKYAARRGFHNSVSY